MLPAFRFWLAFVAVALAAPPAYGAGTAIVRVGAVNVRRAPSLDSPAFASLAKGSTVTVDAVVNGWASVTLANHQQGFIRAAFLDIPASVAAVAAETAPAVTPTAATPAEMPPGGGTPQPPAGAPRAEQLEREVAHLRERLMALESAVATPVAVAPTRGGPGLPAAAPDRPYTDEPARVAGALLPTAVAAPDPAQGFGPWLALAGLGMVVGFLIGAVYGRRQERNRRSRVRF